MSGIVAYVGARSCSDVLVRCLQRLERQEDDPAGAVTFSQKGDGFSVSRSANDSGGGERVLVLHGVSDGPEVTSSSVRAGIGQSRWATHGGRHGDDVCLNTDRSGRFAVVLDGMLDNHPVLRAGLQADGYGLTSQADAELVAHLIERVYKGSLRDAVAEVYQQLEGCFALCAMAVEEPGVVVGVRNGAPLAVGVGDGEGLFASSASAFLPETRTVFAPEDGDVVELRDGLVSVSAADGSPLCCDAQVLDWDRETADRCGYETFMLKEIHEQPLSLADTLAERITADGDVVLDGLGSAVDDIQALRRILFLGCGTSYHAGLIGKNAIERWARLPVQVEVASEFSDHDPVLGDDCLCVAITQSGETADTLGALRVARQGGARLLTVTNVVGSQAAREADGVAYTRAGLEVGIAATKTFLTQGLTVLLFALYLAQVRGALSKQQVREHTSRLRALPALLDKYLKAGASAAVEGVARRYSQNDFFISLGHNTGLPVALEAALKTKETSYIPTDPYPAGEFRHGPIALLEEGMPVLAIATDGHAYDKLVSVVREAKTRGAKIIAVASEGNASINEVADDVIYVPKTDEMLSPLMAVVPMQLFAYHLAKSRGRCIDQPRNLVKAVTGD